MSRTYSICADVKWLIGEIRAKPGEPTYMTDSEGRPLSQEEALTLLAIEQMKGRVVLPMSRDCRNPCEHAAEGCSGFDYGGGGCPGYNTSS